MVKTRARKTASLVQLSGCQPERRSLPLSSRASLLFMQIFGSQLGDGSLSPVGSPTTRGSSSSDTYASGKRSLVGLIAPSSVRVDRPLDQHMAAAGGCAAIYVGAFRNAKGVDVSFIAIISDLFRVIVRMISRHEGWKYIAQCSRSNKRCKTDTTQP